MFHRNPQWAALKEGTGPNRTILRKLMNPRAPGSENLDDVISGSTCRISHLKSATRLISCADYKAQLTSVPRQRSRMPKGRRALD